MRRRVVLVATGTAAIAMFAIVLSMRTSNTASVLIQRDLADHESVTAPDLAAPPIGSSVAGRLVSETANAAERSELRVSSDDAKPIPTATVTPTRWGAPASASRRVDEFGVSNLTDLAPGHYLVDVRAPGHAGRLVKLTLPGREEVRLTRGVPLSIRLRDYPNTMWQDVRLRVVQYEDGSSAEFPAAAAVISAGEWAIGRVTIQVLVGGRNSGDLATLVAATGTTVEIDPPTSRSLLFQLRNDGRAVLAWALDVPTGGSQDTGRLIASNAEGIVSWRGPEGTFRARVEADGIIGFLVSDATLPSPDSRSSVTTIDAPQPSALIVRSSLIGIRRLRMVLVGSPGAVTESFPAIPNRWFQDRADLALGSIARERVVADREWSGDEVAINVPPSSRVVVVAETVTGRSTKEVETPASGNSLKVNLDRLSGATLVVRVPSADAGETSVLLYPRAAGVAPIGRGHPNSDGVMVFTGVIGPGIYRVSALTAAWTSEAIANVNAEGVVDIDLSNTQVAVRQRQFAVSDESGTPLAGVEVYFFREDNEVSWTTTSAAGVAKLGIPMRGVRSLHAFKPGYLGFDAFGNDVSTDAIRLRSAGVLRIRMDAAGAPESASLRVLRNDQVQRTIALALGTSGVIDERALIPGHYRIELLRRGQVTGYREADVAGGEVKEVSIAW